jgi:type VI secretion system VasI family protein
MLEEVARRWTVTLATMMLLIWGENTTQASEGQLPAERCRIISEASARLQCFDQLYDLSGSGEKTSARTGRADGPATDALSIFLAQSESRRKNADDDWLVGRRSVSSPSGGRAGDITAPSAQPDSTEGDRFLTLSESINGQIRAGRQSALLYASCEGDITTFGLMLPRRTRGLTTKVELSLGTTDTVTEYWRAIGDGNILIPGRGLQSIGLIKAIPDQRLIELRIHDSDEPAVYTFNTKSLSKKVSLLRAACHW